LDPVGVPAAEGDTLTLTVTGAGEPAAEYVFTVPPRKPPTILRTYPEKNRRDVPLNVRIEVVFTEPIDPASLSSQTFELRSGAGTIAGTVAVANPERTIVAFTPSTLLRAATEYELVVGPGIRDLDGTPLEAGLISPLTTKAAAPRGLLWCRTAPHGKVFLSRCLGSLPAANSVAIRVRGTGAGIRSAVNGALTRSRFERSRATRSPDGDLAPWAISPYVVGFRSRRRRSDPDQSGLALRTRSQREMVFSEPIGGFPRLGRLHARGGSGRRVTRVRNEDHTIVS
jgi:hypothetical protein